MAQRPQQHVSPPSSAKANEHETAHAAPRVRQRSRKATSDQSNEYYVNLDAVPKDTTVEWKRFANVGEESPFYIAQMREQGWEPVNPQEHPDWVPIPPGYDKTSIVKGGLILMERPKELTNEAIRERDAAAKVQVVEAEQRLGMTPSGELTRDHPGAKPKIVKEMMRPIAIQED